MANTYLDGQGLFVDPDAMAGLRNVVSTGAATLTLADSQSHCVVLATKSSATQTFTLPAVQAGLEYTFICGHASGEILINPTGSVVFNIKASEAGAAVATAAGTGVKNTAATNILGDKITLISDGVAWYGLDQSGIWASQ